MSDDFMNLKQTLNNINYREIIPTICYIIGVVGMLYVLYWGFIYDGELEDPQFIDGCKSGCWYYATTTEIPCYDCLTRCEMFCERTSTLLTKDI